MTLRFQRDKRQIDALKKLLSVNKIIFKYLFIKKRFNLQIVSLCFADNIYFESKMENKKNECKDQF